MTESGFLAGCQQRTQCRTRSLIMNRSLSADYSDNILNRYHVHPLSRPPFVTLRWQQIVSLACSFDAPSQPRIQLELLKPISSYSIPFIPASYYEHPPSSRKFGSVAKKLAALPNNFELKKLVAIEIATHEGRWNAVRSSYS